MNFINTVYTNCVKSYKHIPYTWEHNRAMQKFTKELLGYCPYPYHDLDKIFMYALFPYLGTKIIQSIHKFVVPHHLKIGKKHMDFQEAVFDWCIAHLTKADKQDSGWVTYQKRYWMFKEELEPIFEKYNLKD